MDSPKETAWHTAVAPILDELIRKRQTCHYRDLIEKLAIEPPGQMRQLTQALEAIQQLDATRKRPQRAAVVLQRGVEPIPRPGFFHKLTELRVYRGEDRGQSAQAWHRQELARLFATSDASTEGQSPPTDTTNNALLRISHGNKI